MSQSVRVGDARARLAIAQIAASLAAAADAPAVGIESLDDLVRQVQDEIAFSYRARRAFHEIAEMVVRQPAPACFTPMPELVAKSVGAELEALRSLLGKNTALLQEARAALALLRIGEKGGRDA